MVTRKACLLGLHYPLSLFQAALPPLLSAMLHSAATTSPTNPSAGGDPPSELPAGADPPSEKKRENHRPFSLLLENPKESYHLQCCGMPQHAAAHCQNWGGLEVPA